MKRSHDLRGVTRKGSRAARHSRPNSIDPVPATGASRRPTASVAPSPSNETPPPRKPQLVSLRSSPQLPASPVELNESPAVTGNSEAVDTIQDRFPATGPDRFLAEDEAARYLGLSRKTLQAYRQTGIGGPGYHILGSRRGIRYRLHELFRWAMAREVRPR